MSDSMRSPMPPVVPRFNNWKLVNHRLFTSAAEGKYLENRLREAFEAGWRECELTVKCALEGH